MLEGLDKVPWASLSHAYGEASNLPDQIRGLASDDPEVREKACRDLWNNINHQGTIYEATSYAVPFLIEIAAEPKVQGRADILDSIAWNVYGWSYGDDPETPLALFSEEVETDENRWHLAGELDDVRALRRAQLAGVPTIVKLLTDPDPEVRAASAFVLARLPEASAMTIGPLKERIEQEGDSRANAGAILAVGMILGASASGMDRDRIAEIAHSDGPPIVTLAATLSLVRMTPGEVPRDILDLLSIVTGPALEEFASLAWCEGNDPVDQIGAILKNRPGARLDFQIGLLSHEDARVRTGAIESIESMCRESRSVRLVAAQALGDRLTDEVLAVREAAATTLSHLGRSVGAIIPRLVDALDDSSPKVRISAAIALGKRGDARAMPALIEGLTQTRPFPGVIEALSALGPAAAEAVPHLIRLVDEPPKDEKFRGFPENNWQSHAATTLGRIGEPATVAIPSLIAAVRRGEIPYAACAAWRDFGPATRSALPEIESLMETGDGTILTLAALAHARVSGDAGRSVALLVSRIQDEPNAWDVLGALADLGESAQGALPLIVERVRDSSISYEWPRFHAAKALWRIDRRADVALPILLELFETLGTKLSSEIATTLGEMGPLAREAIPRLRAALERDESMEQGYYSTGMIEEDEDYLASMEAALARIEGTG